MKNILATLTLTLLVACGGGGGGGKSKTPTTPTNRAPVANFTSSCVDLECDFTSTSTDSDGTITTYAWDFGDSTTSPSTNPSYSFATYGSYNVKLTVTDNDAATGTRTNTVTLSIDVHSQVVTIDATHASVYMSQNFNHRLDGDYTLADLEEDMCPVVGVTEFCSEPEAEQVDLAIENGEFKVTMAANERTFINFYRAFPEDPAEVYLSYNVRFDQNFDQDTDFKIFGVGGKIDRTWAPTGGVGSQGPDGGFSSRYVYKNKRVKQYVYHQDQTGTNGDGWYADFEFKKDQDYVIEMRVKMNTPNQADGEVETFINGVSMLTTTGFIFSESGAYGINEFIFVLWTSATAPFKNASTVYLDDITLSTERVVN